MATEEQTEHDVFGGIYSGGVIRSGQKLTITNRKVTKLSFPLAKLGTPTGNVTLGILKFVGKDVIVSKVLGDVSALAAYPTVTWSEVTFDTPVIINEDAVVYVEFTGGDSQNTLIIYTSSTDVKADEYKVQYVTGWVDYTDDDDAYIYTYEKGGGEGGSVFPVDDVARVSSIRHIFRSGFFKMQTGLGDLGFDVDVAEASIRRVLDTAEEIVPEPPYPPEEPPVVGGPYEVAPGGIGPPPFVTPTPPTPPTAPTAPAPPTPAVPGAPEPFPTITGGGIVGGISSIPGLEEYLAGQAGGQEVKKVRCPYCKRLVPAATLSVHIRTAHPGETAVGW